MPKTHNSVIRNPQHISMFYSSNFFLTQIKNDEELFGYLQGLLSYNLFETLASAFINSVVPPGNQRKEDNDQKLKIAWTFEMTSRLSAIDLQPMNRAMGFGAQYVHQHFAPWIQQRGGWVRAESCTVTQCTEILLNIKPNLIVSYEDCCI